MKEITVKVYTAQELKDMFPAAYERAYKDYRDSQTDIFWADETMDSLKAIISAFGARIADYSIDASSFGPSYISIKMNEDIANLSGRRAFAWIENNVFAPLRDKKTGKVKDCPFTGYCADDNFLNALMADIKSGSTIKEAIEGLAYTAGKILQNEYDYQTSEECFLETADCNGYEYTEDGRRY